MKGLRITALLEGLSLLLLLLVAMPLKYFYDRPEAVQVIGMIHGLLFIVYTLWLFVLGRQRSWSLKVLGLCFVAAFLPLGTFYADRRYFRTDSARRE